MIKLIAGLKGSGKTKTLIEMVNSAAEQSEGSVICIEKGDKLRYDISYRARLVNVQEYSVESGEALYGFVTGVCASNYDIKHVFIDSALKICQNNVSSFEEFVNKAAEFAAKDSIDLVITASIDEADLPDGLKKYL
ncbi:MAG: hypothetical protein K6F14_08800 [Clostridiales bacterium]|nr:hypothetical protein [Clostridiales bacterium]